MPNRLRSTAIAMTAMRLRRQKSTNWSIIQEDSALDHDLLAGLDPRSNRDLGALLEQRFDAATLECPRRDRDEHAGAVVVHEQCRTWQHHALQCRPMQRHGREHVGLEEA